MTVLSSESKLKADIKNKSQQTIVIITNRVNFFKVEDK